MDRSSSSAILRSVSTPLEDLKLQHNILKNNTIVSEKNATLLVESLHLTAYLLLLGDRSDSQLIDRMLNNWIHLVRQKNRNQSWNSVSVKFLQTFSTLCYNIRKEAFLAHLLSEVNVIIRLEYNFSDEDAILYYVNFLRMLSFRINNQTIQFFYNELIHDFPLYTEAMRFLYHSESEVRTAVRTISLNVYKFSDASMLRFIGDKAAFANFYNLVWHIGKQMMEVDKYLNTDTGHEATHTLLNLLAEHFDHLDYINDILLLDIGDLKVKLTKHFLHKLFITFVVLSLDPSPPQLNSTNYQNFHNSTMSSITAMYFLSLVFFISAHAPLVQGLAWVILNGNHESLETELNCFIEEVSAEASKTTLKATNTTTVSKPFLDFILRSLECSQNDHKAMPALCLLFTMHTNRGIKKYFPKFVDDYFGYKTVLINHLLKVISQAVRLAGRIRIITFELALELLVSLTLEDGSHLSARQKELIFDAREQSKVIILEYYKSRGEFKALFKTEYAVIKMSQVNINFLCKNPAVVLQPMGNLMNSPKVYFGLRLPDGNFEKYRHAIQVYILLQRTYKKLINFV